MQGRVGIVKDRRGQKGSVRQEGVGRERVKETLGSQRGVLRRGSRRDIVRGRV